MNSVSLRLKLSYGVSFAGQFSGFKQRWNGAYTLATLARISTSLSIFISSKVCLRKRCFLSVRAHPATGHGAGPWEKMRSTHDSHIL